MNHTIKAAIMASDAQTHARNFTGFQASSNPVKSVEELTLRESDLPFLSSEIIGTPVWKVEFAPMLLKLKSARKDAQDWYERNFTVLLQKETGRLLSIKSNYDGDPGDMQPEPNAESATRQLKEIKNIYVRFPDKDPKISFLDAVDAVLARGYGSPLEAKEIHAVYVVYAYQKHTDLPVWVITLRGIPPMHRPGCPPRINEETWQKAVPAWCLNHMRNVIDANTGALIHATNAPFPDP